MIRINLLPVREARRKAEMQQQLLLTGFVIGVSVVVCLLAHFAMLASMASAKSRVAQLNSQITEFQGQLAQVEDFKHKASEIERKLGVIRKLELSRSGPVRLLDELATRAPEKLWITSLQTDGNRIKLKGMSLDTDLIAQFLRGLTSSPYMKDVELSSTELSEMSGLKLNSFQLTAALASPEPEPAAPAAGGAAPPSGAKNAPAAPAKQG